MTLADFAFIYSFLFVLFTVFFLSPPQATSLHGRPQNRYKRIKSVQQILTNVLQSAKSSCDLLFRLIGHVVKFYLGFCCCFTYFLSLIVYFVK